MLGESAGPAGKAEPWQIQRRNREQGAQILKDHASVDVALGTPRVISLFSGAGGLDYGLEAAGFGAAVAVEMNPDCCMTLRANRDWKVIEKDIFDVSTENILEHGGLKSGSNSLLVGGPPCQPFSKASWWSTLGKRGRLDDPRAGTIAAFFRVLEEALPRAFILENVDGLAYRGKDEGMHLIINTLELINKRTGANYTSATKLIDAAEYGVPQHRRRYLVVGVRDGDSFEFPQPICGNLRHCDNGEAHQPLAEKPPKDILKGESGSVQGALNSFRTAWDALADIEPDPAEDLAVNGQWGAVLPSIPEGHNYLWHADRLGKKKTLFGWRTRYWSFLLKLAKDRPSWTISAQPGPNTGPFHWANRRLSMRELCRLQTFPDDVNITGTRLAVQRQVGNAVPSLLAEVLGRALLSQVFGERPRNPELSLLPHDRSPVPAPEKTKRVPKRYRSLYRRHKPHPGPGRGPGALAYEAKDDKDV